MVTSRERRAYKRSQMTPLSKQAFRRAPDMCTVCGHSMASLRAHIACAVMARSLRSKQDRLLARSVPDDDRPADQLAGAPQREAEDGHDQVAGVPDMDAGQPHDESEHERDESADLENHGPSIPETEVRQP